MTNGIRQKLLGSVTISPAVFEEVTKDVKNIGDFKKKIEAFLSQNITDLFDVVLSGSMKLEASDIHLEAQEEQTRLRIRMDGILHNIIFFEPKVYRGILSRIKLLSKLKLNIADRPQDGRFSIEAEKTPIEIRTSTIPAEYGESVVMRILNPKSLIGLEDLGLRQDLLEIFKKCLKYLSSALNAVFSICLPLFESQSYLFLHY